MAPYSAVKDQLKELGFWFSSKHRAWVYNGGRKLKRRTSLTLNDIRNSYGYELVRDQEEMELLGGQA
jgi:hypothetical protein